MRGYVMVGSSNLKESKSFYDAVLAVIGIISIYEDDEHSRRTQTLEDPIVVTRQNDKTEAIRRVLEVVEDNISDMSSSAYKNIVEALGKEYNN